MKINKKTFGIVGVGMVGQQLEKWFNISSLPVFSYDKFKGIGSRDDLRNADIIFLCLPTPHSDSIKSGVDLSSFLEIIEFFNDSKIFVIKSTIPVGTTEYLQEKFHNHLFFHNPEFLTEITAWEDFINPHMQIFGYGKAGLEDMAEKIMSILPRAKFSKIIPAKEAEIFKFARNAFFANKVIFANHIYDLADALGADYEIFREIMEEELRFGKERDNHFKVIHKGYRGFGGKCLPKDLKTFIKIFQSQKLNPELLLTTDKVNEKFLKEQDLAETLEKIWLNNKS